MEEKQKKSQMKFVVIAIVMLLVLVVMGGGAYYFMNASKSSDSSGSDQITDEVTKKVSPEDIGLTVDLNAKKNGLNMSITKLDGISSVDYEATYDASVKDGADTLTTTKGIGPSTIEVKSGDSQIVRNDLTLGTCSRNVCTYDNIISDITFTLRINYKNGEVGSVELKVPYK